MNLRDLCGRTPLHMAVAFNNKIAVETLMYLGANPHIKDAYGQRPIDNCYVESIRSLLEIKMASTQPPIPGAELLPEETKSQGFSLKKLPSQMNKSFMSGTTQVNKEEKTFPIEPKDIRQVPKEKVISARIGTDGDSYVMYAIKNKRIDVAKFLLREVSEIDLLQKNSLGMTALHLAIRSDMPAFVKLLVIRNHKNTE